MMGLHPTSVNDNPHWREELGIAGIHTGNYQKVQSNYYDWRMMSAFLRAN
jgi:hypothetical protein